MNAPLCCVLSLRQTVNSFTRSRSTLYNSSLRFYATGWKKNITRQEERKKVVYQYAGKNIQRADRVYGWGWAAVGALGIRSFLKPLKHQGPRKQQRFPMRLEFFDDYHIKVTDVDCGYGFTVFLCEADHEQVVYGTGINTDSQLGFQESPRNSGRILDYVVEPAIIELPLLSPGRTKLLSVACGRAHTLILTDREGVFSLGHNAYGQCGHHIVEDEIYRGSQTVRKLQLDKVVTQAVCGQDHSLLLTADGEVYSCGLGADGQTGLGHYETVWRPTLLTGDIEGEKIIQLSSRADCVLALSESGAVFGWGNSEYNQLASVAPDSTQVSTPQHLPLESITGKVKSVAAAASMCAVLNESGDVYVWGYGLLGKGPRLEECSEPSLIPPTLFGRNEFNPQTQVTDIKCGISYFAAVTDTGDLYTWGRNKSGCLGLGTTLDQFFPYKVHVPAEVHHMACGVDHTIALCKAYA